MTSDVFLYCGEADTLEIRLNELNPVVDRFVIVEGARTFTGHPKPLYFEERDRDRFARWNQKIVYIPVEDLPTGDPWGVEGFQRDVAIRGLDGIADDDRVMLSDLDEIPRASIVRSLPAKLEGDKVYVFQMRVFYYGLNVRLYGWHNTTRMVAARTFRMWRGSGVRHCAGTIIPDAGWHISYQGGVEAIRRKLAAFSHQEYFLPKFTDPAKIRERMYEPRDLFDRPDHLFRFVPIDESYPAWVRENIDRLGHMLIEGEAHENPDAPVREFERVP